MRSRWRRLLAYLPWISATASSAVRAYKAPTLDQAADEREAAEHNLNHSLWRYLK